MTDTSKMRSEFEAWYAKEFAKIRGYQPTAEEMISMREGDGYGCDRGYLNGCWKGWQASRQAENEALRRDAERLSWLDDQYTPVTEQRSLSAPEGDLVAYRWTVEDQSASVREAIDAAMAKEQSQ